jgi:hypothetical protein
LKRSSGRSSRPPEFLVDRSLGSRSVPAALRAAGLAVCTLADIYGEQQSQLISDPEWISYAAEHDLVVLCKDDWIRRRPLERRA